MTCLKKKNNQLTKNQSVPALCVAVSTPESTQLVDFVVHGGEGG